MKVCLTLDDFSVLNNRLDLLWRLKNHFPTFKVSLFTIPDDIKHTVGNREEALKKIKECLPWMQIIPHGYQHNGSSEISKMSYNQFRDTVHKVKEAFDKDGLPFVEGFKPPHWNWNAEVVRALDDLGWFGAVSPKRPDTPRTKRIYQHTHGIDEQFPLGQDLKLQGHINGTSPDDLERCFDNLLRLPQDTTWHFVTEYL